MLVNYMRSPYTLLLLIALIHAAIGIVLTAVLSWPATATLAPHGWAVLSGLLWGAGALFMFHALRSEEVSRVVPIFQTYPIFAALMAVAFLGEKVTALDWAAVLFTVGGATILSIRQDREYRRLFLHRSFFVLILGSVIAASAFVIGAVALESLPVLNTHALRDLGLSGTLLLAALRRSHLHEIRELFRRRSPALVLVSINEFGLASVSFIMILWALSLGPVTLVTTLVSTRSLFLVLYSILLTLRFRSILGERVTPGTVAVKLFAVTLIVGGVSVISLG